MYQVFSGGNLLFPREKSMVQKTTMLYLLFVLTFMKKTLVRRGEKTENRNARVQRRVARSS